MRTLSRRPGLMSAVCLTALPLAAPLLAQPQVAGHSRWRWERMPAAKTRAVWRAAVPARTGPL